MMNTKVISKRETIILPLLKVSSSEIKHLIKENMNEEASHFVLSFIRKGDSDNKIHKSQKYVRHERKEIVEGNQLMSLVFIINSDEIRY